MKKNISTTDDHEDKVADSIKQQVIQLTKEGKNLAKKGKPEAAIAKFEKALQLNNKNIITLNSYATTLARIKQTDRAIQLFESSLEIENDNIVTLNQFANLLAQVGDVNRSIRLFEKALELNSTDIRTITSYAHLLMKQELYHKATELFARAIQIEKNNPILFTHYAKSLFKIGQIDHAIQMFEFALELNNKDVITLISFANLLLEKNEKDRAINLFEKALVQDSRNIITMSRLASLLAEQGDIERAIHIFEQALEIDNTHIITLNNFANLLAKQGDIERSTHLFERSLGLDGNDIITLNRFANFLAKQGEIDRAILLLQHALEIKPNDHCTSDTLSYIRLQYANQLETQKKLEEAVEQLLAIDLVTQISHKSNVVRLRLGRLYYLLHQPELGMQYFEEAIAYSEDQDKSRLYAARSLLVTSSGSEEAVELLRQIEESSPRYDEAMKAIALNANPQTAYELFAGGEEGFGSTEMLYRAIYHKIGNEVAILNSIAHRLLRNIETEHPMVRDLIHELDDLQDSVNRRRAVEKAEIANIPRENYQQLIKVVSKTAHDIADEVNNILATIESKMHRTLRKLPPNSPLQQHFEKFLGQLKLTQTALTDLKSINEGIIIRRHRFPVRKLFEKWDPANWSDSPGIQKVNVTFKLENPDAEFEGDEEKIKSIINELVENSLKHNQDHPNLSIWMFTKDLLNPTDIGMPKIPGDRKYLYIQISDNGKGVPPDKKEWIFQPLNTTSPEEKGSGLGLFIVRRTLQKMGGYIRETGEVEQGAKFQLYLPYPTSHEIE